MVYLQDSSIVQVVRLACWVHKCCCHFVLVWFWSGLIDASITWTLYSSVVFGLCTSATVDGRATMNIETQHFASILCDLYTFIWIWDFVDIRRHIQLLSSFVSENFLVEHSIQLIPTYGPELDKLSQNLKGLLFKEGARRQLSPPSHPIYFFSNRKTKFQTNNQFKIWN